MRTRMLAACVLVLVVLGAAAGGAAVYLDRDDDSAAPDDPTTRDDPTTVRPPEDLELPAARAAGPVLGAARGPVVDPAAVRARLAPLLRDDDLGRHVGVAVTDLVRARDVLSIGASEPFVPASTLKLFTAAAVLEVLGPDHRFETRVLLDRAGPGPPRVVLVGGGDPLLARAAPRTGDVDAPDVPDVAAVDALAATAAAAVTEAGVRRVRVGYDSSLFAGPAAAPSWEPSYVREGIVSPVSALWVDRGLGGPGLTERSTDPALDAGRSLAERLGSEGVAVVGRPEPAPGAGGEELAAATGAPLEDVVTHMLQDSDNEVAEVLLRHVGIGTDRAGSFAGGTAGLRETLTRLGVSWRQVVVRDGSGLSRANEVTLGALTAVLRLGADPALPELRAVLSGLPVARFNGSLAGRFLEDGTVAARGVVRAKTGTLTGVNGLAGSVVTRDGALLGFALLTDRVRLLDTLDARAQLDRLAAALAACGCR